MKSFLIKIMSFGAGLLLLYVVAFTLIKNEYRKQIDNFDLFILGDSGTEYISHPAIYNRSVNASPYFIHYEFAKEFSNELKGKRVYISLNYIHLSKLFQNRLENDSLYPGWRSLVLNQIDEFELFNYPHLEIRPNDMDYAFFDREKLPNLLETLNSKKEDENTSYNLKDDTLAISEAIERHWNHPGYVLEDVIQREYLRKLIALLKLNNCEIVLLKMPLMRGYIEKTPSNIKNELKQLPKDYNIRLLDLNEILSISKSNHFFKDYGHLNKFGDSLVLDYFSLNELKTLPNSE